MMDKPVLFMIHGLMGSLAYFNPAGRITTAAVHTCDLLGYGGLGGASPGRLTLQAQVDHVARKLAHLGEAPAWILGHSVGGAIAMLLADRHPNLIRGMINVEGNFTPKDAFYSGKVAAMRPEEWSGEYHALKSDISAWVELWDVDPTPEHVERCTQLLCNQPPGTIYAMSRAVVDETRKPGYLDAVRRVVDRGLPIHLIAGQRSTAAWDVPEFVRRAAVSSTIIPQTGHLMMLEEPEVFCREVDRLIREYSPAV